MPGIHYSKTEIRQVRELFNAGANDRTIVTELNMDLRRVQGIRRKHGMLRRGGKARRKAARRARQAASPRVTTVPNGAAQVIVSTPGGRMEQSVDVETARAIIGILMGI